MISALISSLFMEIAVQSGSAATGVAGLFMAFYLAMMSVLGLLYCVFLIGALISFVVWVWMLIDCLSRKDYTAENDKLLWALVIIFAGILGAAIYYFMVKRKKDRVITGSVAKPGAAPEKKGRQPPAKTA